MDIYPIFYFYYDSRGDGQNEFTLRKWQVTFERLEMIFKLFGCISRTYVIKKDHLKA